MGDIVPKRGFYPVSEVEVLVPEANHDLRYQIPSEDQPLLGSVSTQPGTTIHTRSSNNGFIVIFCTVCVLFANCALNSLVTLNITKLSSDFDLDPGVELWPMSMHYLAQGCSFLLAGSLADVLGSRRLFLSGCFLQTICYLMSGLAASGVQLITFRILSGVAYPMCFISAMNLHRELFPAGKLHDLAISCTRGGQYAGSVIGMILSGVQSMNVGWRWGFHCAAVLSLFVSLLSIWAIPKQVNTKRVSWAALTEDIDWAGTLLVTLLMAFLFSVLAIITNHVAVLSKSGLFIPLALGWVLLVAFLFWHDCWERDSTQGIQSSLWTNSHFLSIGLVVFFIYASSHTTSQLIVLVFQRAQGLSVLQSSWRLLPIPIIGALSTHFVELLLPRVRANEVLTFAIVASSFAPLIMAVLNPNWPYWECAVFAVSLNSVASSSIIPIAAILIFESFSLETQRLAMGVICTIAMVGASVGMALAALISNDVTASENASLLETSDTWMSGYRVTFYFLLALNLVGLAITLGFLQKIGYLGRSLNT